MRLLLLLLLAALFAPAGAQAVPDEGTQLRLFLAGTLRAREIENPAARAAALRELFAGNWHLLGKLVDQKDGKRILRQAGLDKFLPFNFSDPGLPVFHTLSRQLLNVGKKQVVAQLARLPDEDLAAAAEAMARVARETPLSRAPTVSSALERLRTIKIAGFQQSDVDFLSTVFLRYFDELDERRKLRLIAAWLEVPGRAPWNVQFQPVIQNAGPFLQKFLQLVGRESSSRELTELATQLLSGVQPVPFTEVRAKVEHSFGRPIGELFRSFDERPAAAGTTGQGNFAVSAEGVEEFVKTTRPGIREEMIRDAELFARLAKGNAVAEKLISQAKDGFVEGADMRVEAANTAWGRIYADPALGLDVPRLDSAFPVTEDVLVYNRINGTSLEKAGDMAPELRAQALRNAMAKWFDVALEEGRFHGDMHPGNIMIRPVPGENGLPFLATFVDFGSVGNLSREQRKGFLLLYAAAIRRDTDAAQSALSVLSGAAVGDDSLRRELAAVLKSGRRALQRMDEALAAALNHGMEIDKNLSMFSRSGFALTKEMDRINKEILAKDPAALVEDPELILIKAAARDFGRDLWKAATFSGSGSVLLDGEVTREYFRVALARLGGEIEAGCEALFGRVGGEQPL